MNTTTHERPNQSFAEQTGSYPSIAALQAEVQASTPDTTPQPVPTMGEPFFDGGDSRPFSARHHPDAYDIPLLDPEEVGRPRPTASEQGRNYDLSPQHRYPEHNTPLAVSAGRIASGGLHGALAERATTYRPVYRGRHRPEVVSARTQQAE